MLRLVLIRHAKAEPGGPGMTDHARALAARGRHDAPRMGRWIADGGHAPAEALCSDAARTRETLGLMLFEWPAPPRVSYLSSLYHADPDGMLATLAGAGAGTVAMVGHNPGIGHLARDLAAEPPAHPRWEDFPTAAVAVLGFEAGSWTEVRRGRVLAFAVPSDLS